MPASVDQLSPPRHDGHEQGNKAETVLKGQDPNVSKAQWPSDLVCFWCPFYALGPRPLGMINPSEVPLPAKAYEPDGNVVQRIVSSIPGRKEGLVGPVVDRLSSPKADCCEIVQKPLLQRDATLPRSSQEAPFDKAW